MFRLLLVFLLIFVCDFPGVVLGRDYEIAVLDITHVVQNSLASKKLQQQFEAAKKKLSQKSSDREKEFYQIDKNLSEQRNVLAQDVFENKVQEFTKSVVEAQRGIKEENAKIDMSYSNASEVVAKKIESIVSKLMEDKKIDIVLPKLPRPYPVYVGSKVLDISKSVLDALDDALPSTTMDGV